MLVSEEPLSLVGWFCVNMLGLWSYLASGAQVDVNHTVRNLLVPILIHTIVITRMVQRPFFVVQPILLCALPLPAPLSRYA